MKYFFWITGLWIGFGILLNQSACSYNTKQKPFDFNIKLRWVKAYQTEDWEKVRTGLIWTFAYLGADLPQGSFDQAVVKNDEFNFAIDISKLGFSTEALYHFKPILTELRQSVEYQAMGGIDIGKFLMFTLHSSWHYYAITGTKTNLNDFRNQYFNKPIIEFKLSSSGVAKYQRLIKFCKPESYQQLAFIGEEGYGKFEDNTFKSSTFETIDMMPNGQLRFGIYDGKGKLKTAADSVLTLGGKPGKCQWCHEKIIQPLFYPSNDFPNSISRAEFLSNVSQSQSLIDNYRSQLKTDIRYERAQDHSYSELLYITYLEPSADRLALEWNMEKGDLLKKLAGIETHTYREYPYLGNLYHRKDVNFLAPFSTVITPESAREHSSFEPDLHQLSKK